MDECGHDHKQMPYEARGGICLPDNEVWNFTCKMQDLESQCFGVHLYKHGSEIKATKLLNKRRFEWAAYAEAIPAQERRQLCRQFLANTARHVSPTRRQFCAFGQASLLFVRHLVTLLHQCSASIFASMIPLGSNRPPDSYPQGHLRRDLIILFQRYFYFLEDRHEMGLVVLDETDRTDDSRFLRKFERFFQVHFDGQRNADLIIPTPFFVGSDLSYPVQAADIVVYCLVQSHRQPQIGMNAPVRQEVFDLVGRPLNKLICRFEREIMGEPYRPLSVFYVDHPWSIEVNRTRKKKVSHTGVVFRAPRKTNLQQL